MVLCLIISHQERILDIADEIIVIADGKSWQEAKRKRSFRNCSEKTASTVLAVKADALCSKEGFSMNDITKSC